MTTRQTAYDLAIKHLNQVKDERDAAREQVKRLTRVAMSNERPPITEREVNGQDRSQAAVILANVDGVSKVPPDLYYQALDQLADFIAAARYYLQGGF